MRPAQLGQGVIRDEKPRLGKVSILSRDSLGQAANVLARLAPRGHRGALCLGAAPVTQLVTRAGL
jgi:hypothetical protein